MNSAQPTADQMLAAAHELLTELSDLKYGVWAYQTGRRKHIPGCRINDRSARCLWIAAAYLTASTDRTPADVLARLSHHRYATRLLRGTISAHPNCPDWLQIEHALRDAPAVDGGTLGTFVSHLADFAAASGRNEWVPAWGYAPTFR